MFRSRRRRIVAAVALSVIATAFLFNAPGTNDIHIWERWISLIQQHGLINGYALSASDYPPGAFAILLPVSYLAQIIGPFAAIKFSLIAFLAATAAVVWFWTRRPLLVLAVYAMLLINAVGLAYLDVYTAPFLLASLYMLSRRRWSAFAALYFCACMIKWQPLIVAPFLAVYMIQKIGWRRTIRAAGPEIIGVVLIGAVFGLSVLMSLQAAMHHDTWSGNALNVSWIAASLNAPVWYPLVAKAAFASAYGMLLVVFSRQRRNYVETLRFALLGFLTYFMLNIGVHENHLYTVLLLAIPLYIAVPDLTLPIMVLLANANLIAFYGLTGSHTDYPALVYTALAAVYVGAWVRQAFALKREQDAYHLVPDGERIEARQIFDALTKL